MIRSAAQTLKNLLHHADHHDSLTELDTLWLHTSHRRLYQAFLLGWLHCIPAAPSVKSPGPMVGKIYEVLARQNARLRSISTGFHRC